jgi:YbbR domain-containing protein
VTERTERVKKPITLTSLGRSPARTGAKPPAVPPPEPSTRARIRRWVHGALFDNIGLKFLSVVLAITVFLLVNSDRDREISARVGVSYGTVPEDKVLISPRQEEVYVTIKGPWRRLRKFDERKIDRIDLDLSRAQSGEVAITHDMVHLPTGLSVANITPSSVRVVFERKVEHVDKKIDPPPIAGHPLHGYRITDVTVQPPTIQVRGGESAVAAVSALRTREINVNRRSESFSVETELVLPDGIEVDGPTHVMVRVGLEEELVKRTLPGVTVMPRGDNVDPGKWSITPAQVDITLTGTLLAVEKAQAALVPSVKVSPNAREAQVVVEGLPPLTGVKVSPERVKVAPNK